ncbi:MAG: helix-turn-helix domain-containing protein [Asticcacaulis sp.]
MRGQGSIHPVDTAVGEAIRRIRKARGLTQEALAEGVGVTFQQVQKYEHGTNRVSCSTLIRICEQLEAHPMDILPPLRFVQDPRVRADWYRQAQSLHYRSPHLFDALMRLNRAQLQALLMAARAFN